jgi:antitoxin VapB
MAREDEIMTVLQKEARLVRSGGEQTLKIPPEFEFAGDRVILTRVGDHIEVRALPPRSLADFLDGLEPLDEDFPEIADPPPRPISI